MRTSIIGILLTLVFAGDASAHLMPADRGTVNIVGNKAYIVVTLPVAAFETDECADGVLTQAELNDARTSLRAEIVEGLELSAGSTARFDRVLLNLPTGYDHDPDKSADLTAMTVAVFPNPIDRFTLRSSLWSEMSEPLVIEGSLTSSDGKTTALEQGILTASHPSYDFFAPAHEVFATHAVRGTEHLLGGIGHVLLILLILVVLVVLVGLRRWQGT